MFACYNLKNRSVSLSQVVGRNILGHCLFHSTRFALGSSEIFYMSLKIRLYYNAEIEIQRSSLYESLDAELVFNM